MRCWLQNGMTSNFLRMPIRTTHYTGTITDIALLLGRSYRHGVDKSKATVLTTTVVLFGGGAAAVGALIGSRIGDHALIPPACLASGGHRAALPAAQRPRGSRDRRNRALRF